MPPNFKSFSDKKIKKNEWKWRILHRWTKIFTAAGSYGIDKSHLCEILITNISNSNNLNKFWGGIFTCQGHITQVY